MTTRRTLALAVAAVYLGATLLVSYAVWGPYDGVEHDPSWAGGNGFFVALLALHVAVGAAVGRWWALALPVLWAVLSAGAGGYDTPVPLMVAFTLPFYWLPAVAVGVALRRLLWRRSERRELRPS